MSGTNSPQGGLTRRSFLKTTAAVAGATALAGGAGLTALADTDAAAPVEEYSRHSGCFWACYNCCYDVVVRDGKAVNVKPREDDPRSCRPCIKGYGQLMRLYSPKAVKYPMKRVGERGSGEWERISWDQAIDEVSAKLKDIADTYGPQSIIWGTISAMGTALKANLYRRLASVAGWCCIDMCVDSASVAAWTRVCGYECCQLSNEAYDLRNANTIFVWGKQAHSAYPQEFKYLMDAKQAGTRLICIDPAYTVTASKADVWVPIRPGTDAALVMAMINRIIEDGNYDEDFMVKWSVAPVLVRHDTKEFLRASDLGIEPTEGPIDPMTGMPTVVDPWMVWDSVAGAPAPLDSIEAPALRGTYAAGEHQVTTAFDLLAEKAAEYPVSRAAEICDIPENLIEELAGYALEGPVTHYNGLGTDHYDNGVHTHHSYATLMIVTGQLGFAGTGGGYSANATSGNSLGLMFPTMQFFFNFPWNAIYDTIATGMYNGQPWPIKCYIAAGANPLCGTCDQNRGINEVIPALELLLSIDVVSNDITKYADYILPASVGWCAEDVGNYGATRTIMHYEKVVDTLYESKNDHEIARILADALGYGQYFQETDEEFLRIFLDTPELKAANITLDTLREKGPLRLLPQDYVKAPAECTSRPSGKLEFYAEKPTPRVDFGQSFDADLERLPCFVPPTEAWHESEYAEKYPIAFISERAISRLHTQGYENPVLLELIPEPYLEVNPDDAKARGIEDNDIIYVWNDRGHAVARAFYSPGVRPGSVRYIKGWQNEQFISGDWCTLTSSRIDPVGVNNSFFDAAVEYRKWDGEE